MNIARTLSRLSMPLLVASLCVFILGCSQDDVTPAPAPSAYSNQIVLNDLSITGDSVKLTWSKLDTLKFAGYLIVRKDQKDVIVDPTKVNSQYIVTKIFDPSVTTFTDRNLPLEPYLEYQVIGLLSNGYNYNYIFSNPKPLERSSIKVFNFQASDILPDLANNRFYIIESDGGKISILNYETLTVTKSIVANATLGFCALDNYGGTRELYVPRSDGWVFVYNAETLEKIDQIDIAHPASCVVSQNGKLFISTDAWTNRPLRVFNRATKTMISETGDFDDTRLRIIPGSNTEIIEVTINIGPTDLDYYRFDPNGNSLQHVNDRYHGDYPLNADIFQFFPDGKKFITSAEGAIYDIGLNYINRLPKGDLLFSDYAFSADASTIYCASSNAKSIVAYSNPNFIKAKEYKTQAYPYKIFRKGNDLICISKTISHGGYPSGGSYKLMIEKIQL